MKYAIVELQGHQFWIQEGTFFISTKIFGKINECIRLCRILFIKDKETYYSRISFLKKRSLVYCLIKEHFIGTKISIIKMKSKAKYRKKAGHRQMLTKLLVGYIVSNKYRSSIKYGA